MGGWECVTECDVCTVSIHTWWMMSVFTYARIGLVHTLVRYTGMNSTRGYRALMKIGSVEIGGTTRVTCVLTIIVRCVRGCKKDRKYARIPGVWYRLAGRWLHIQ